MKFKRETAVTPAQRVHTRLPPLHTPLPPGKESRGNLLQGSPSSNPLCAQIHGRSRAEQRSPGSVA